MAIYRSRKVGKRNSNNETKYVQSKLQFGKKESKIVKCPKCEMTYTLGSIDDKNAHDKYHDLHLKGRKWSNRWGSLVRIPTLSNIAEITPPSSSRASVLTTGLPIGDKVVMIQPDNANEVKATLEILEIVNNELNAPHDENDFWSLPNESGRAFVYIKNDRAVGVITIETLEKERCRWMVYSSKSIVANIRPNFILGISRIWVCKTERCHGIASALLEAARNHTIYGKPVEKWEIAWSQPTESGGKLASKYNGVTHKSGKLLLPCYI
ncbi:hypothetical protein Kpol_1008p27 [Vanderwaltozyma polyspora DSM 70294]|uniref:N-acetyltransferase ECO1 n=1 Tax=Vanderwaltozyma polyspora (strain ATCC 22028 / DSM 70294 / BCRC 21397 / CBS 2163 / NBRC 10782 / NRRL Y-8283 / UCD 57-17) TaxID=436907 RepID=A7TPZ0_VANPO|nr:uncharacterized protein Kpol_1008p27 [Vanderwaltozyma polyspora DSM 70294]EDO15688.1 hypothetical protein Kpol_1008p27 [Vanderwaltozyma polyspora DSM 70294]